MTQKEFEERTELKLTADNYTEVETCYMNTDLDKDAFCKLWMKNPAALKEIEQKTVLVRELYEERKCLANFLIIIFDHNGRRLGKIEFGVRNSVPSAKEIKEAIKDGFPNGTTYKLLVPTSVCINQ